MGRTNQVVEYLPHKLEVLSTNQVLPKKGTWEAQSTNVLKHK
jgi:hypothetical protein